MNILRSKRNTLGFIVFTIFIILFDQASKLYIQHNMHIGESIPVIPTQLYSSLYGFLIFFILLWMKKYKKYDGHIFLNFLVLYSISRFVIEFFRFYENSYKVFNLLTVTQTIMIGVMLASLLFMNILKKKRKKA